MPDRKKSCLWLLGILGKKILLRYTQQYVSHDEIGRVRKHNPNSFQADDDGDIDDGTNSVSDAQPSAV